MLVFQNTNFKTQFNWYACFAFANPFSMWLKNRDYFFFVGNHFSLDDTTFNLADLTLGMLEVVFNFNPWQPLGGRRGCQLGQDGLDFELRALAFYSNKVFF
jgi:hypothetical protein